MKRNTIAILTALVLAGASQATAGNTTHAVRPDLREVQQKLAWEAQNSKGGHSQALAADALRLDRIIEDLEQGRSVDPREIDRALERADRGSF